MAWWGGGESTPVSIQLVVKEALIDCQTLINNQNNRTLGYTQRIELDFFCHSILIESKVSNIHESEHKGRETFKMAEE